MSIQEWAGLVAGLAAIIASCVTLGVIILYVAETGGHTPFSCWAGATARDAWFTARYAWAPIRRRRERFWDAYYTPERIAALMAPEDATPD